MNLNSKAWENWNNESELKRDIRPKKVNGKSKNNKGDNNMSNNGNWLEPIVNSLLDTTALLFKSIPIMFDKWGNLVYRVIERKPYEGDISFNKDVDIDKKVEYNFIPLEAEDFNIYDIPDKLDYKFIEGEKNSLKACIGIDLRCNPVWVDMLNSHLLVAGMSRWGKSNILNVMMTSFIKNYTPNEVKFLLCDYKCADIKQFEKYEHVVGNASTCKKEFLNQVNWVWKEGEKRAKILNKYGKLNAISYNADKNIKDKMTYIIFVIDELPQVTLIDKDCKDQLHMIMSKMGSYGIYFICATQDCAKEVVGRMKINISQTIGLHTRDKTDSDMIIKDGELDSIKVIGRAKLDCRGLTEFQSFYISEEEIKSLLEPYLK